MAKAALVLTLWRFYAKKVGPREAGIFSKLRLQILAVKWFCHRLTPSITNSIKLLINGPRPLVSKMWPLTRDLFPPLGPLGPANFATQNSHFASRNTYFPCGFARIWWRFYAEISGLREADIFSKLRLQIDTSLFHTWHISPEQLRFHMVWQQKA